MTTPGINLGALFSTDDSFSVKRDHTVTSMKFTPGASAGVATTIIQEGTFIIDSNNSNFTVVAASGNTDIKGTVDIHGTTIIDDKNFTVKKGTTGGNKLLVNDGTNDVFLIEANTGNTDIRGGDFKIHNDASNDIAFSVIAESGVTTIKGATQVETGGLTVTLGGLDITGTTTINDANGNGTTTIGHSNNALNLHGDTISMTGKTALNYTGPLNVTGATTINDAQDDGTTTIGHASNALNIHGNTITVTGNTALNYTGPLNVTGATTINDAQGDGTTTIGHASNAVNIHGTTGITGATTVTGTLAVTDTFTVSKSTGTSGFSNNIVIADTKDITVGADAMIKGKVAIRTDGADPVYTIDTTGKTDAALVPKGDTASRNSISAFTKGLVRFNADSNLFEGCFGTTSNDWLAFSTGASGIDSNFGLAIVSNKIIIDLKDTHSGLAFDGSGDLHVAGSIDNDFTLQKDDGVFTIQNNQGTPDVVFKVTAQDNAQLSTSKVEVLNGTFIAGSDKVLIDSSNGNVESRGGQLLIRNAANNDDVFKVIAETGATTIKGATIIEGGGANITGNSSITGTLGVTAQVTASNSLIVTTGGATISSGGLTVTAGGIISHGTVNINTVASDGNTTVGNSNNTIELKSSSTKINSNASDGNTVIGNTTGTLGLYASTMTVGATTANMTITTTNLTGALNVTGATTINDADADGTTTIGHSNNALNLYGDTITMTGKTALNYTGPLNVTGATTINDADGDGNTTVGNSNNTFTVNSSSTKINSNASDGNTVVGNTTGTLGLSASTMTIGATTTNLTSAVNITGATTINDANGDGTTTIGHASNALNIHGNTITVTGNTALNYTGPLNVTGATTINDAQGDGTTTIGHASNAVNIQGTTGITGATTVTGTLAVTDTFTVSKSTGTSGFSNNIVIADTKDITVGADAMIKGKVAIRADGADPIYTIDMSAHDDAILLPVGSNAKRPGESGQAVAAKGLIRFNVESDTFEGCFGTTSNDWTSFSSGASGVNNSFGLAVVNNLIIIDLKDTNSGLAFDGNGDLYVAGVIDNDFTIQKDDGIFLVENAAGDDVFKVNAKIQASLATSTVDVINGTFNVGTSKFSVTAVDGNILTKGGSFTVQNSAGTDDMFSIAAATGVTVIKGETTIETGGLIVTLGGLDITGTTTINDADADGTTTIGHSNNALNLHGDTITVTGKTALNYTGALNVTGTTTINDADGDGNTTIGNSNNTFIVNSSSTKINSNASDGNTIVGNTTGTLGLNASTLTVGATTTNVTSAVNITGATNVLSGGLSVTAGGFNVIAGGATIAGNSSVTGTFGATALVTASNGITVTTGGATVTAGGLTVDAGGMDITGNSDITGTLGVTSDFNVATNKFVVTASSGDTTVAGTFKATGISTFSNDVIINSNLTVSGDLNVAGSTTTFTSSNVSITDNIFLLNSGPGSVKDSGLMIQRYDTDITAETAAETGDIFDTGSTNSNAILKTPALTSDDDYNGWYIKVTSGTANGDIRKITDYTGSTKTIVIDEAWTANPASNDSYELFDKAAIGFFYDEANSQFVISKLPMLAEQADLTSSIKDYTGLRVGAMTIDDNTTIGGTLDVTGQVQFASNMTIGADAVPRNSADLDIVGTKALILPNGTTAERPTSTTGMIRYNSTTVGFEGYDGSAWGTLGGGGAVGIFYDFSKEVKETEALRLNNQKSDSSWAKNIGATGINWNIDSASNNYIKFTHDSGNVHPSTIDFVTNIKMSSVIEFKAAGDFEVKMGMVMPLNSDEAFETGDPIMTLLFSHQAGDGGTTDDPFVSLKRPIFSTGSAPSATYDNVASSVFTGAKLKTFGGGATGTFEKYTNMTPLHHKIVVLEDLVKYYIDNVLIGSVTITIADDKPISIHGLRFNTDITTFDLRVYAFNLYEIGSSEYLFKTQLELEAEYYKKEDLIVDKKFNTALILPVGTQGEQSSFTPAEGHLRFNSTSNYPEVYIDYGDSNTGWYDLKITNTLVYAQITEQAYVGKKMVIGVDNADYVSDALFVKGNVHISGDLTFQIGGSDTTFNNAISGIKTTVQNALDTVSENIRDINAAFTVNNNISLTSNLRIGNYTETGAYSIDCTGKKDAVLLPVGSNSDRPTPLVKGLIRFNEETNVFEGYNGTGWVTFTTS